jgi:hypothetical protein
MVVMGKQAPCFLLRAGTGLLLVAEKAVGTVCGVVYVQPCPAIEAGHPGVVPLRGAPLNGTKDL